MDRSGWGATACHFIGGLAGGVGFVLLPTHRAQGRPIQNWFSPRRFAGWSAPVRAQSIVRRTYAHACSQCLSRGLWLKMPRYCRRWVALGDPQPLAPGTYQNGRGVNPPPPPPPLDPLPPDHRRGGKTTFTIGKTFLGLFWYTHFWFPDPFPPSPAWPGPGGPGGGGGGGSAWTTAGSPPPPHPMP